MGNISVSLKLYRSPNQQERVTSIDHRSKEARCIVLQFKCFHNASTSGPTHPFQRPRYLYHYINPDPPKNFIKELISITFARTPTSFRWAHDSFAGTPTPFTWTSFAYSLARHDLRERSAVYIKSNLTLLWSLWRNPLVVLL